MNPVNDGLQADSGPKAEVTGTVKSWNTAKAFGWIQAGRSALFFHIDDVVNRVEPRPGQVVRFMVVRAARGPRALAVEIVGEEGN